MSASAASLLRGAFLVAITIMMSAQASIGQSWSVGSITIDHAWGRIVAGSRTGSVYLRLTNGGQNADTLMAVSSNASQTAMLHTTSMDNGVASMTTATEGAEIPPRGSFTLKPGGTHIMLIGTRADLKVRDLLPLRVTFQRAGSVDVAVPIFPLGAPDPFAEK